MRWDSLGEFLAIAVSLEHFSIANKNPKAKVLAETLDEATGELLENGKSPSRVARELDNRGSHFYLALYWAEALAKQNEDLELKNQFIPIAKELKSKESQIVSELNGVQGKPVDIGGYYLPNQTLVSNAMRPSKTFNNIVDSL